MAVLTRDELAAAVAALEWIARRADLHTVLNGMPAMRAEKKLPKVTEKGLRKAINFLKSKNGEAAQTARIARGMKIKEWLQVGELEGTDRDTKELLTSLGGMLGSACVHDIVGPNLFQGSDGRYYTVVVEASIEEASDDVVQDALADRAAEADDEEDEPERNDGEPGPAEDPDPRPHPRFGPPTPALKQTAAELAAEIRSQLGKPLVEVLDTSDTPPLRVADVKFALCARCDHFIDENYGHDDPTNAPPGVTLAKYIHCCDEEHHDPDSDHNAEPRGEAKSIAAWKAERPDLFVRHPDGLIGPNSKFHVTLLDAKPAWEGKETETHEITNLLDRVEAEAVAGADAIGRRQAHRILTVAAEARGLITADYLDDLADQIPIAWSRYGGWHLPALKQELAAKRDQLQRAGGRGVELADEIDLLVMVVALREAGITTVDDLTALDGDE